MGYNYFVHNSWGIIVTQGQINEGRKMNKVLGVFGTILLLLVVSLSRPNIVAKASCNDTKVNEIVITQELPKVLTYEELSRLYSCKEDKRVIDPAIIEVDQEDAVRLMKLGQAEAGENDPLAIAYVMMVVINRLNSDAWPNTIEEIITQKKQFSVYKNGAYDKAKPNANAHYALYLVESGQVSTDAEYFESDAVKDSWQSKHRDFLFDYAGHRFYK